MEFFATAMAFGAVFVPDFFLQAAVRSEPGIRNRPLALVDGPAPTFRVMAVNRLASQLGLTLGLTKTAAAEFQGVEIRPRRKELEEAAHAALLDAAWSVSPRVEDTAVDTVLIDLAGLTTCLLYTSDAADEGGEGHEEDLSLIHISEPTRPY